MSLKYFQFPLSYWHQHVKLPCVLKANSIVPHLIVFPYSSTFQGYPLRILPQTPSSHTLPFPFHVSPTANMVLSPDLWQEIFGSCQSQDWSQSSFPTVAFLRPWAALHQPSPSSEDLAPPMLRDPLGWFPLYLTDVSNREGQNAGRANESWKRVER